MLAEAGVEVEKIPRAKAVAASAEDINDLLNILVASFIRRTGR